MEQKLKKIPTPAYIKELVENKFGIEDIAKRTNKRPYPYYRYVAFKLCKDFTGASLNSIGKAFDNRDHSTVFSGLKKFKDYENSRFFKEYYDVYLECIDFLSKECVFLSIKQIKFNFDHSVKQVVRLFEEKQELDFEFFVNDDHSGVACFSNEYYFNIKDICKDVFEEQPKGLIVQWQEDCIKYENQKINYNSYAMGLRFKNNENEKH